MGKKLRDVTFNFNFDSFNQDIEDYLTNYSIAYARAAQKDLTDKACEMVRYFYSSYNPEYYIRTDDFMDNSYRKYFHHSRDTYYGGVKLSSEWMSDYSTVSFFSKKEGVKKRVMSKDAVFQNAWDGVHGVLQEVSVNKRGESREAFNARLAVTTPSPYSRLIDYYEMVSKERNGIYLPYEIEARTYAKSKLYRTIMFV